MEVIREGGKRGGLWLRTSADTILYTTQLLYNHISLLFDGRRQRVKGLYAFLHAQQTFV